jgi:antirestriction protein ArdC
MDKKICQMVTDRLIEEMEKGIIPWNKPWHGTSSCISHTTGKPYSLVNQFVLGAPGEYITFNQCKAEGGSVKKGAKGKPVVFWKQTKITEKDPETGEEKEKLIPLLKYYTVFHINDCENIKAKWDVADERPHANPIEEAEAIVTTYENREQLRIDRTDISDRAYYSPSRDYISVPSIEQYTETAEYYSTLFHEMTHSTGHTSRLNRFTGKAACAAFGSEEYSKEELIAEIGAASLVNYCGIENKSSFRNSAAYLQGWLRALKNDPSLIISAAGKAEKAFTYIVG